VSPWQAPESHPFFGTQLCVPESHTFWRNAASSCVSAQKRAEIGGRLRGTFGIGLFPNRAICRAGLELFGFEKLNTDRRFERIPLSLTRLPQSAHNSSAKFRFSSNGSPIVLGGSNVFEAVALGRTIFGSLLASQKRRGRHEEMGIDHIIRSSLGTLLAHNLVHGGES
jgi:hypothetical protein